MKIKILVTGVAGFIGFHVAKQLLQQGHTVIGIDNLNDYYAVELKQARLNQLEKSNNSQNFCFIKQELVDQSGILQLFDKYKFDKVVHLAAQAGVRYSILQPHTYIQSNIVGFLNILEGCRHYKIKHLVYASSSSVYGANTELPFSEKQNVSKPLSLYGASKLANEVMAYSYSSLYQLPTTGLRFFTVYGPWGRPDMALFKFTKAILQGDTIQVFNNGEHTRDFTYVDDIVTGILKVLDKTPISPDNWKIFNIGNNNPVKLMDYIKLIEDYLGKKANIELLPLQPGDIPDTYADISSLEDYVGYKPSTTVYDGVKNFLDWYMLYYNYNDYNANTACVE